MSVKCHSLCGTVSCQKALCVLLEIRESDWFSHGWVTF